MAPAGNESMLEVISVLAVVTRDCGRDDPPALSDVERPPRAALNAWSSPTGTVSTSDHNDLAAVWTTTAGSLPLPEINAPGGLGDNLLKGLSSPAFHNTLASLDKPGPKASITAASTASPAATTAAAAAFTLSMGSWATANAQVGHAAVGCSQADAHGLRFGSEAQPRLSGAGAHTGGCILAFAPTACAAAGEDWSTRLCWQASPCAATAAAATAVVVLPRCPLPLTTKRGLYEGTVRGGNARNTWIYSTARTPPG